MFDFGETITVQRRAERDPVGDHIAAPVPHSISGVGIAPETGSSAPSSTEATGERSTVIVWRYLYCPAGADIQASDAVILPDGRTYLVDGEPAAWKSPYSGWTPGVVVRVKGVF